MGPDKAPGRDITMPTDLVLLVAIVSALIDAAYLTYAVRAFSQLPFGTCLFRVTSVLALGYLMLAGIIGEHTALDAAAITELIARSWSLARSRQRGAPAVRTLIP
jgi:hypothetical protein